MKYYKMISGTNIVGIATQRDFVRFQQKHKILINCEISVAQFVLINDILYRDVWLFPLNGDEHLEYSFVTISEIDEEEYSALSEAFETHDSVVIEDEPVQEEIVEPQEDLTVEFVKKAKLIEISNACNNVITTGFDIELSDGNVHHFSLTTQDQLNLITLSAIVGGGATSIPYHADGELCRFYSVEDISAIISYATSFKTYQVSYHNALKLYVESLDNITDISNVRYGMEIPEQFISDVLRALDTQGE